MALRSSNTTSSAPAGSSSAADRRSSELYESRRSDPEMPRTRIGLRLRELELDGQLDVVGQGEPALGQRRVPVEAELRAVDDRLKREADLRVARDVLVRPLDRAGAGDLLGVALDRQVALDGEGVAVTRELERRERDLGVALGVEEVRRLQVAGQVLVLDDDRVGVDRAVEVGRAVLAHREARVEVLEAAAEGRDDHVLDRESGGGVDAVVLVGAGGKADAGASRDGAHLQCSPGDCVSRTAVRFLLDSTVARQTDRGPVAILNRVETPLEQLPAAVELPVPGQQPRRRKDAAPNYERVLCTAARLFEERGPENCSMELIASEAGVGKGTLFRAFGDRAGLA